MQADRGNVSGIAMIVLSMSLIGYIDNYIAVIAGEAGLWQFHFVRSLILLSVLGLLARIMGWRVRPRRWRPVIFRSFLFSSSMVIYFGAAGIMPVSQAAAGLFTAPIFVLLISVVFLGQRIGLWRVLAVVIGFGGAILILRPEAGGFSPFLLLPIFAGGLYGLGGVSTRQWCGGESTATLMVGSFLALGIWGAVFLSWFWIFPASPDMVAEMPFFARGWVTPTPTFLIWTTVQALGAICAVGLLTRGYQVAEVSFAAVAEFWFLIAAAFWSYILWDDVPDMRAVMGAAAIILAGVIIVLRSREGSA